jgi:hypothetical protein
LGNTGSRAELIELYATFGNYPLLIRALAGEVARFRQAPRDFAAWRRANPGFDPFSLSLVQRKAHVLEYALGGLTEQELRVLHTVAAFRSPTVFPTLAALLVGDDRPCATQADLDQVLTDLEDRGLLGWDRVSNRYDLHPVVRGVAWSSLDPDARHGIDLRLARHLGEAPEVDQESVTSMDDLSNTIELYHTLVRLGQLNDASELPHHGNVYAQLGHSSSRSRDEFQRVPDVLAVIKAELNRDRRPGRFVLAGSARHQGVPELADFLTGRVELLTLWPFAMAELVPGAASVVDRLFDGSVLRQRRASGTQRRELVEIVLRGGYPITAGLMLTSGSQAQPVGDRLSVAPVDILWRP